TYLGGSGDDGGQWIAMDTDGTLIHSGYTASTDFPVTSGAFQTAHAGGAFDACITRIDPSLSTDPTPTPTAPDTPTPEPTPPPRTGVTLWMPSHNFSPTDPCRCTVTVCNAETAALDQYPLFVILDVAGMLFFAPGFSPEPDHYLAQYPSFPPGNTLVEVLPEFPWPAGTGTVSGILFYAGLTNPEMTALAGDFDVWEFGWFDSPTPVPMEFVEVPAGIFEMGAPENELCREPDEIYFTVTLTQPIQVLRTEVTQFQWESVFGSNPSYFEGMNRPVERVTWFDACIFCNRLSLSEGLTPCYYADESFNTVFDGEPPVSTGPVFWNRSAGGYRLPTEAEWEYVCRAGTTTAYCSGETSTDCDHDPMLDPLAWYAANSNTGNGRETHPVGRKLPNRWNIFNLHGNVGEWCWDWYGPYP
nr:formylglycine-generating enzyme family protein [bacterium]